MELFPVYPLNEIKIVRAEGARVFDEQGRSYLDFYGGHAVISIGHQHPHWKRRIEDQLSKIAFYSNSVKLPIQEELARTMGKITDKEQFQLFLCNSGAEANENAMKLASFHTGRKKIIAFKKSFHGRTSLAVAATDNPAIIAPVNETQNVDFLPFNDPHTLVDHFAKNPSSIAAVILEGIQGVGGIHVATSEFIKAVRKLCDQYGAVYIADSVQCGYGRSGHFFSHDHAGVEADLYTMAKGMGNGFPIGGVLIHPKFKAKPGMLGTTFGGNPLACAAALAVLEVLEKDRLVSQAVEKGHYLMQQLSTIPGLLRIRGMGLMIGFDLPESRREARKQLLDEFRIFTGEAKPHTIRLLPALTISKTEMDELIEALRKVMGTGAY